MLGQQPSQAGSVLSRDRANLLELGRPVPGARTTERVLNGHLLGAGQPGVLFIAAAIASLASIYLPGTVSPGVETYLR